jgi:transaldolase
MNPLKALEQQGQSVWLDFITRQFISDGSLTKLIQSDGVKGVTSNPTIFQKAIAGGAEYDAAIAALQQKGLKSPAIFEALAVEDIQAACDLFRPVYDQTKALDGYVSLEVNPHLARNTQGTLDEARQLFRKVNRPNVMIKIPGTQEGLSAIEQALGDGININVTLIFSLTRYQQVMDAWIAGLERAAKNGKPLGTLASVASFFVSRVDSLIDGLLEKKVPPAPDLLGQAAIANAREAYGMFLEVRNGPRFQALAKQGAQVQRPLWASTSTKNPKYRDVMYVEQLIGRETVDTMPLATIDAFRDHGQASATLPGDVQAARQILQRLEKAGISMAAVTKQLEEEGLKSFSDSYDSLIKSLDEKKEALKVGSH